MTESPRGRPHGTRRGRALLAFTLLAAALFVMAIPLSADDLRVRPADDRRIPVAILGDSDSHGYQDGLGMPRGGPLRGGAYRDATRQWTEVLAELRPDAVDLGDRGTWGTRRSLVRILEWFGVERRAPRKQDHQFNFAFSGARCRDLEAGVDRQTPRLLQLMTQEAERWQRGVVICRIGIVDLGGEDMLEKMAHSTLSAEVRQAIDAATACIAGATASIRRRHAKTRIVLVGIFDNSDAPPLHPRWQTAQETANIRAALDHFDAALRQMTRTDPNMAFFDDRAWFHDRWGFRDGHGKPAYEPLVLAERITIRHGVGDAPEHTALADGHAGLVVNTLWCQSLTQLMAEQLHLPIQPITDTEVVDYLRHLHPQWR